MRLSRQRPNASEKVPATINKERLQAAGDAVPRRAIRPCFLMSRWRVHRDTTTHSGAPARLAPGFQPRRAGACRHQANRRLRHAASHGDVFAGQALPAQRNDCVHTAFQKTTSQAVRRQVSQEPKKITEDI